MVPNIEKLRDPKNTKHKEHQTENSKIQHHSASDKTNDKKESCAAYILRRARQLNRAFTYSDLGKRCTYGTYRNTMSQLVDKGEILKLPKENPARFILPEWASRPEYSCVQRSDKKGIGVRFDFSSFLEGLGWDDVLSVHALKFRFGVYSLRWLGGKWEYCKRSHSYRRRFDLSYPVSVQCFDTGTVLVSVKSTARPFRLDSDGLLSLTSLLGEVRASLDAPCIPEPSAWLVVQWHLNRDSEEISGDGLSFNMVFRDFFNDVARFYYKYELKKVRAEVVQNPSRSVKDIFETILNRVQIWQGDT